MGGVVPTHVELIINVTAMATASVPAAKKQKRECHSIINEFQGIGRSSKGKCIIGIL